MNLLEIWHWIVVFQKVVLLDRSFHSNKNPNYVLYGTMTKPCIYCHFPHLIWLGFDVLNPIVWLFLFGVFVLRKFPKYELDKTVMNVLQYILVNRWLQISVTWKIWLTFFHHDFNWKLIYYISFLADVNLVPKIVEKMNPYNNCLRLN